MARRPPSIEVLRRRVPVEHGPFDAAVRPPTDLVEQRAADSEAPVRGPNEQIFEPDPVAPQPRRKGPVVQRESRDVTFPFGDHRTGHGVLTEEVTRELVRVEHHRVGFAFVLCELSNHGKDVGKVRRARVADRDESAHFFTTNGGLTTCASSNRPRTSTCTATPGSISGRRNASAIVCPSDGEKLPLVTAPDVGAVAQHPGALPSWPPTRDLAARATGARSALPLGRERRPSAEVTLLPADHPPEARLQRRDAGPELVTVQRKTRFQAKRVTRAETCRHEAGVAQRVPQLRRVRGRYVELHAVLTGVPGAGDDELADALHREPGHLGRFRLDLGQQRARFRSLDREDGPCARDVRQRHTALGERIEDRLRVRRVRHDEEAWSLRPTTR